MVYELPSVPVTVTRVAFVAVTVKVEELPALTEVGLAVMVTVGADDPPEPEWAEDPHPVTSSRRKRPDTTPSGERIRQINWGTRTFVTVFTFFRNSSRKGATMPRQAPQKVDAGLDKQIYEAHPVSHRSGLLRIEAPV
jgi:hypothetical protein